MRLLIFNGLLEAAYCLQASSDASALAQWKTSLEIVTWVFASAFIAYKLITGYYFHPDMSVTLVAKRSPKHISACLTVKKGERGGIELHDARVQLCDSSGQAIGEPRVFSYIRRYRFDPEGQSGSFVVEFREDRTDPMLLIVPGDEMQFSTVFEVTSSDALILNAAVLGRQVLVYKGFLAWTETGFWRFWSRKTLLQWHASAVSLPDGSGNRNEA